MFKIHNRCRVPVFMNRSTSLTNRSGYQKFFAHQCNDLFALLYPVFVVKSLISLSPARYICLGLPSCTDIAGIINNGSDRGPVISYFCHNTYQSASCDYITVHLDSIKKKVENQYHRHGNDLTLSYFSGMIEFPEGDPVHPGPA